MIRTGKGSRRLLAAVLLTAAPALCAAAPLWRWEVAGGLDATTHTYHLAVDDTTETITEARLQAAVEARSARDARHRWRVRADGSLGTELNRQRLDAEYRLSEPGWSDRLRADLTAVARQYHPDSDYVYNSDNNEGSLELRGSPLLLGPGALELRARGGWRDYRRPSTLEVDDRTWSGAVFLRAPDVLAGAWAVGLRATRRVYPDSSEIDRDELGVEATWESRDLEGDGLYVHHVTRRRVIADPTVRPSAWSHWTDARLSLPAGAGHLQGELQAEVWAYDTETEVWFDSWRLQGYAGYRGGDLLAVGWQAGLAAAHLEAGDNPDTYSELGLRAGLDSYAGKVGGTLTVEVGRRVYADGSVTYVTDAGTDSFDLYTDFTYWRLWLMGQWSVARNLALEALASYEPERHTEQADDAALGFLNLRLVWRP